MTKTDLQVREVTNEQRLDWTLQLVAERLVELETAFEAQQWDRIGFSAHDFSVSGRNRLVRIARTTYLAYPLIKRGINVRTYYTFGNGVAISARDEDVDEIIQSFINDPENREQFFDAEAQVENDHELQNSGNYFSVLFTNPVDGRVRIRYFPVEQISQIMTNPDDVGSIWFYKRQYTGADGTLITVLHPDINYSPKIKPSLYAGINIRWDAPIAHLKTGGTKGMMFGLPDSYAALTWAKAHKGYLEDWSTLVRSLSRFAWKLVTTGDVQEAIANIQSTAGIDQDERNPSPPAGSVYVGNQGADFSAIPKTDTHPEAKDSRELRMMIAAAFDLPDHLLAGDVDVGNLATASTLDRPTELMAHTRQRMWLSYYNSILNYVLVQAVKSRKLSGRIIQEYDRERVDDSTRDMSISIDFGSIVDTKLDEIEAIIKASTLDGKTNAGIIPVEVIARELLVALGIENIEEILDDISFDTEQNKNVAETLRHLIKTQREAARV